jgi:hypothetical protein
VQRKKVLWSALSIGVPVPNRLCILLEIGGSLQANSDREALSQPKQWTAKDRESGQKQAINADSFA